MNAALCRDSLHLWRSLSGRQWPSESLSAALRVTLRFQDIVTHTLYCQHFKSCALCCAVLCCSSDIQSHGIGRHSAIRPPLLRANLMALQLRQIFAVQKIACIISSSHRKMTNSLYLSSRASLSWDLGGQPKRQVACRLSMQNLGS